MGSSSNNYNDESRRARLEILDAQLSCADHLQTIAEHDARLAPKRQELVAMCKNLRDVSRALIAGLINFPEEEEEEEDGRLSAQAVEEGTAAEKTPVADTGSTEQLKPIADGRGALALILWRTSTHQEPPPSNGEPCGEEQIQAPHGPHDLVRGATMIYPDDRFAPEMITTSTRSATCPGLVIWTDVQLVSHEQQIIMTVTANNHLLNPRLSRPYRSVRMRPRALSDPGNAGSNARRHNERGDGRSDSSSMGLRSTSEWLLSHGWSLVWGVLSRAGPFALGIGIVLACHGAVYMAESVFGVRRRGLGLWG